MSKLFSARITAGIFSLMMFVVLIGHVYLPRVSYAEAGDLLIKLVLAAYILFSLSRIVFLGSGKKVHED